MELSALFGNEKYNYIKIKVNHEYFVTASVITNYGKKIFMIYPYYKLHELKEAKKSGMGKKVGSVLKEYKNGTDSIYDIFYWLLVDVIVGIKDKDVANSLIKEMFWFSNSISYNTGYINKEQFIYPGKRFLTNIFNRGGALNKTVERFIDVANTYMDNSYYADENYTVVEI